jgi:hypothetical protein
MYVVSVPVLQISWLMFKTLLNIKPTSFTAKVKGQLGKNLTKSHHQKDV